MPSPPITIGELTSVPAPDSPIASAWAQEISHRVVHRFADTVTRDAAYPAATAGLGAICEAAGILYVSNGTTWVDVGQSAAHIAIGESRTFLTVTTGSTLTWSSANQHAVEVDIPVPPTWSTQMIVHLDLLSIFQLAGTTPGAASFVMSRGAGPTAISMPASCTFAGLNQRQSLSWSCLVPAVTSARKIYVSSGPPSGTTWRFDTSSSALFDVTWLP